MSGSNIVLDLPPAARIIPAESSDSAAMFCPYCQSPVNEDSPACPRCGLNMDKANAFFGTVPRLVTDLTDVSGVLATGDARRIRNRIRAFGRRFPQSGISAAFMPLPKDTPGPTYTWWIFNRSNPAGEMNKGCTNRHLFLLVDTAGSGAWLTAGYGLEPFVGQRHLQQILGKAQPHFARGHYAAGTLALIGEAESVLRGVVSSLPRVFGLEKTEIRNTRPPTDPATAW